MGFYDAVKDAVNIAQKADNIDLYRLLLDVQKESLDLLSENNALKEKIKELENNSKIDESLIFKDNCYYGAEDVNYKEPYCSKCWDTDRKLVRIHTYLWDDCSSTSGECPNCKTQVEDLA